MAREFIEKQDTLNDGREKLNRSITRAYDADEKSDEAIKTSNEAKQTSEEANDKSDYTQVQLDTVTGASTIDPAVEQLRVGSDGQIYPSPDARIRTEHEKVTAQLAQTIEVINVKSFGAIGDGVTDDTISVTNAIQSLEEGQELYFPNGVYNLETWEQLNINKGITLTGQSKRGTMLVGNQENNFLKLFSSFVVNNIGFSNFKTLFWWETINEGHTIEFSDNSVRNSGDVLMASHYSIGAKEVIFSNNDIDTNFKGQVVQWTKPVDRFICHNNILKNIYRKAIQVGGNDNVPINTWRNIDIQNNHIENVDGLSAISAYGVIVYGTDVIIQSNTIKEIKHNAETDCEGIYVKSRNVLITNNMLFNAGRKEGSIVAKRAVSNTEDVNVNIVISNNIIDYTAENTVGITIAVGSVTVSNNKISNCHEGIIISGSNFTDIEIVNNVFTDIGDTGIRCWSHGDGLRIFGNVFNRITYRAILIRPVDVTRIVGKTEIRNWMIGKNSFRDIGMDGIHFRLIRGANSAQFKNLTLSGNDFYDVGEYGIVFECDLGVTTEGLSITDNVFDETVNPIKPGTTYFTRITECYFNGNVGLNLTQEGVATITTNNRQTTISTNFLFMPKHSDITITPSTDLGDNAVRVSHIGTSNFTIAVGKPVPSTVTLHWKVEINNK